MPNLVYYAEERIRFADAFADKVSEDDAELIFDKLKRHYKFTQPLVWRGNRGGGKCCLYRIQLGRNSNIATIAHEVAHAIQLKKKQLDGTLRKGRFRWHSKKHTAIMKRVLDYIYTNKAGWFSVREKQNERSNEMAKQKYLRHEELSSFKKTDEFKIQVLQKREKKLVTKLKRAENALKKVRKKIKYYEKKTSSPSPTSISPPIQPKSELVSISV